MSRPTASLCSMLLITDMVLVELELAKQWISLLRSVLGCFSGLIHHIRAPESWSGPLTSLSPRGWWTGPTVTAIIPRQFQQVSKPPLGASPPLAAVNYRQLFVGWGTSSRSDRGCRTSRRAYRWRLSDTQDPVFFFCPERPMHPINTGIMLTCTVAHLPPAPLYLSSSLSSSHFGTC